MTTPADLAAAFGSFITVITVGSLWLTDRILKRQGARDKRDRTELSPFVTIAEGTPCAKCGAVSVEQHVKRNGAVYGGTGLQQCPFFCVDGQCPAHSVSHLHVYCRSCKAEYFMATADDDQPQDDDEPS